MSKTTKKVWIDLDNSPHVPFFAPIIHELEHRGYSVLVTARDCFQVRELANLFNLQYRMIGHHYGKHKLFKLAGLCVRAAQLTPIVLKAKPDVALSHGSRSQLVVAKLLHVPSIMAFDYEFTQKVLSPEWLMAPEVVATNGSSYHGQVMTYPGIKEDVYVPSFKPDESIVDYLGIQPTELVVTLRPPATEAHYHNPESEVILNAVLRVLQDAPNSKVILLPRNRTQEVVLRKSWAPFFESGRMVVPAKAVDGLNLIWHSDLVISGGGTMNREAAALGVPVYSIFRGKIGAVDRELARTGRLVLVENAAEVSTKIALQKRQRSPQPDNRDGKVLRKIVENVVSVLECTTQVQVPVGQNR